MIHDVIDLKPELHTRALLLSRAPADMVAGNSPRIDYREMTQREMTRRDLWRPGGRHGSRRHREH